MNWILAKIVPISVAAMVVSLAFGGVQTFRLKLCQSSNETLQVRLDAALADVETVSNVAESNLQNLTKVTNDFRECVESKAADVAAAVAAAEWAIAERGRIERELTDELERMRGIYESEGAIEWSDTAVPPVVVDRVRNYN